MSESYNDPSNRYDQAYMQEGVYEYHDDQVYRFEDGLDYEFSRSEPFKPPPPSEATSSYITAPVRRTFIQRNKWEGTTRPRYDASGKLEALWGTVNDITVLGKYKGAIVKGDKDYKSLVQRIKDAWLHGQKVTKRVGGGYEYREPSFGVETSTSKKDKRDYQENLRRKAEEKKLDAAAFTIWVTSDEAQVAIAEEFDIAEDEEEEFRPLDAIREESWTSANEKLMMERAITTWRHLGRRKKERYRGRAKTICGGFAKQLLADRVLTTILEAQEEIYADIKSHQPKSDALERRAEKNLYSAKAATIIQSLWRGASLRSMFTRMCNIEIAAMHSRAQPDDGEPTPTATRQAKLNAATKLVALKVRHRRGIDGVKRNRRDQFVGIPGAECDMLGEREQMKHLRAKLGDRFDFFSCADCGMQLT